MKRTRCDNKRNQKPRNQREMYGHKLLQMPSHSTGLQDMENSITWKQMIQSYLQLLNLMRQLPHFRPKYAQIKVTVTEEVGIQLKNPKEYALLDQPRGSKKRNKNKD
ncbi:hypothetical protein VNO77_25614 [Canavalia gladiata]|uniref:Uncharacterized protein n=1 Tax=Canavalia gladiata TaxID=3824 RepID=A0AAN9L8G0_CANGL